MANNLRNEIKLKAPLIIRKKLNTVAVSLILVICCLQRQKSRSEKIPLLNVLNKISLYPYALCYHRSQKRNLHFTAQDDSAESCEDGRHI